MNRLTVSAAFVFIVALAFSGAAVSVHAQNFEIPLIPEYDVIGDQIEVIQGYYLEGEDLAKRPAFGIYDTGASVVTLSAADQESFRSDLTPSAPVPIKVPNGAAAEGVGGDVTGHVSDPGYVISDGIHVLNFSDFSVNFNIVDGGLQTKSAVAPNVQMFVGTTEGSASLPTISGTPIHASQTHGGSAAALITRQGYSFDLMTMFPELITESTPYEIPDLQYVESGTLLKKSDNTTDPFRIPIALIGEDNQSDPGNQITIAKNPFVADTRVAMGTDAGAASVEDQNFLFDTGAMMSLISPDIAEYFGLNPTSPTHRTLDVVGASGTPLTVHGYDIPLLEVPYDNLDGTAGLLQFTNVPVFVLDVGAGIDGILGMNLFNTAVEMLYDPNPNDPNGASLQVTFSTTARVREEDLASLTDSDAYALFGDLSELYGEAFASMFVRIPYIPSVTPVPEPATVILLAIGASFFWLRRFVGRRR